MSAVNGTAERWIASRENGDFRAPKLTFGGHSRWGRRGAPSSPSMPWLPIPCRELPTPSSRHRGQNLPVSHPFQFVSTGLPGGHLPPPLTLHFSNLYRLRKWVDEVQLRGVNPEPRVQSVEVHSFESHLRGQLGLSEAPTACQEKEGCVAAPPLGIP